MSDNKPSHTFTRIPNAYVRKWNMLWLDWKFECNSSKGSFGRFGGGWNWVVGIQIGGGALMINLLIASLRISKRRTSVKKTEGKS